MTHAEDYNLVFRSSTKSANPTANPNHIGFTTGVVGFWEIMIACSGLLPVTDFDGDAKLAASGLLYGVIDKRFAAIASIKPQYVLKSAYDASPDKLMQPFAYWDYFVNEVLGRDHLFLFSALKVGTNEGAGLIPRSKLTRVWDSGTSAYIETVSDEYWTDRLPLQIVVTGSVEPSRADNGLVNIPDIKLVAARME